MFANDRRSPSRTVKLPPLCVLAVLGSALGLTGCLDEPGTPSESDEEPTTVKEELSFQQAAAGVGFSASIAPWAEGDSEGDVEATSLFGGMASADVDLNGADDVLVLGGTRKSKLLLNDGEGSFDEASLPALSEFATGAVFADIDGDSYPDLLVPSAKDGSVAVYLNDEGDGWNDATADAGFAPGFAPALAASVGDVDGDDDLDVFVLRVSENAPNKTQTAKGALWINDGQGHFSDSSIALGDGTAPLWGTSALLIDLNEDRLPDLFITRDDGVSLWLNRSQDGETEFQLQSLNELGKVNGAFAAQAADLDNDTDFDLLLSGVGGVKSVRSSTSAEGGSDDADLDADAGRDAGLDAGAGNDGTEPDAGGAGLDAGEAATTALEDAAAIAGATTLSARGENLLIGNDEAGFAPWAKAAQLADPGGAASCIADFNNDGYQDVFQATVAARAIDASAESDTVDAGSSPITSRLYLQFSKRPGEFIDLAAPIGLADAGEARAVICFDYDKDGDIDIALAPFEGPARLYENKLDPELGPANYVGVRVLGSDEHPSALGAVVTVVTALSTQTRIIGQGRSSSSQAPDLVHFGIGSSTTINGLFVAWPDGADDTLLEDLAVNSTYTLKRK